MPIERMRLMVTILLKKISTEKKLKELGFEKRLIDNILIDSLKCAGRKACNDNQFSEAERLKLNVEEFLEWTIPTETMTSSSRIARAQKRFWKISLADFNSTNFLLSTLSVVMIKLN